MPDGPGGLPAGDRVGGQRVIEGDCLTVMAAMAPESVDVVVTSPPYNLAVAYTLYDDRRVEADYVDWLARVTAAVRRVLTPEGSFFLNLSGTGSQPWLPFETIVRLRQVMALQNHIVWVKSVAIGADSVGHYKPIGGGRFLHHTHEHIFHMTKTGAVALDRLAIGVPFKDKSNIARRAHARDLRCRGNTWFIPYRTVRSKAQKFNHPGTFPIELPLWCLYLTGLAAPVLLDPFAGSGSSLVAAHRAGAFGIGIDLDPAYAALMRERLAEEVASVTAVVLGAEEMAALLRLGPEAASLQSRLNKTTGRLALTPGDVAQASAGPLAAVFGRVLGVDLFARLSSSPG